MKYIKGFDAQASANINPNSKIILVSILIPNNLKLVITHFANYASPSSAWGKVKWNLLKNGLPVNPHLTDVMDEYGTPATPQELGEKIIFNQLDLMEVVAENIDSTNIYSAGVYLRGYYAV